MQHANDAPCDMLFYFRTLCQVGHWHIRGFQCRVNVGELLLWLVDCFSCLLLYIIPHLVACLKWHSWILWVRSPGLALPGPLQGGNQDVSWGCSFIWKNPLLCSRDCWQHSVRSFFLAVGWNSPSGPCHVTLQAAYCMATCFFKASSKASPPKMGIAVLYNVVTWT